jgi:uncharacterized protein YdaU (DUF1376 family)
MAPAADDLPLIQMFVDDAMAETAQMDATEGGVYFKMLLGCWRGGGSLPFEPRRLARLAGLDPTLWDQVWAALAACFVVSDDGKVSHPPSVTQMARARKLRKDRQDNAAETNKKRRENGAKRDAERNVKRDAQRAPTATLSERETSRAAVRILEPDPDPAPNPSAKPGEESGARFGEKRAGRNPAVGQAPVVVEGDPMAGEI